MIKNMIDYQHIISYMNSQTVEIQNQINDIKENSMNVKGKRYADIVIGTIKSGHTEKEVDYLCDGEKDEDEIMEAINKLAELERSGNILLLPGNYYCSSTLGILTGLEKGTYINLIGSGSNNTNLIFQFENEIDGQLYLENTILQNLSLSSTNGNNLLTIDICGKYHSIFYNIDFDSNTVFNISTFKGENIDNRTVSIEHCCFFGKTSFISDQAYEDSELQQYCPQRIQLISNRFCGDNQNECNLVQYYGGGIIKDNYIAGDIKIYAMSVKKSCGTLYLFNNHYNTLYFVDLEDVEHTLSIYNGETTQQAQFWIYHRHLFLFNNIEETFTGSYRWERFPFNSLQSSLFKCCQLDTINNKLLINFWSTDIYSNAENPEFYKLNASFGEVTE